MDYRLHFNFRSLQGKCACYHQFTDIVGNIIYSEIKKKSASHFTFVFIYHKTMQKWYLNAFTALTSETRFINCRCLQQCLSMWETCVWHRHRPSALPYLMALNVPTWITTVRWKRKNRQGCTYFKSTCLFRQSYKTIFQPSINLNNKRRITPTINK